MTLLTAIVFKGVFHTINPFNLTGLGNYTLYVEMTDFDLKKGEKKPLFSYYAFFFLYIMATYLLRKWILFVKEIFKMH